MIDAGHLILLVIAALFGLWGFVKSKHATIAQKELANELFDRDIKELRNEIINTPNDELVRRANDKYRKSK